MTGLLDSFYLTPFRHRHLVAAVEGLRATGVPLVGLSNGRLTAAGASDDPGLYALAPILARALGLSPDAAAALLLGGLLVLATVVGVLGWLAYARGWPARAVGAVGIAVLAAIALAIGDTYTMAAAAVLGLVPPLLAVWRRAPGTARWAAVVALAGFAAGGAEMMRAGAGVVTLAFAAVLTVGLARERITRRAALLVLLAAAAAVPVGAFRYLAYRRDAYIAAHASAYAAPVRGHVFWHQAYIGFGFLANDDGLAYRDEVAYARVAALNPAVPVFSPDYERVLRGEVFALARRSPAFVLRTLAAKSGIIAAYGLLFANLGLAAALRARRRRALDVAFALAMALAAVPGLVAMPAIYYLQGFTALAMLFGAVGIESWLSARKEAGGAGPR